MEGHTDDGWFGVVADGHGQPGRVISLLRKPDWARIAWLPRPVEHVVSLVRDLGETVSDGSTVTIVRVRGASVQVFWLGDSSARIYRSGREVWRTTSHRANTKSEAEACARRGALIRDRRSNGEAVTRLKVIKPFIATLEESRELMLGLRADGMEELTVLSRSLGHLRRQTDGSLASVLGSVAQSHTVHAGAGEHVRVVVASDGLWDVMTPDDDRWLAKQGTTARLIVNLAKERWQQEWTYRTPGSKTRGDWSPRDTRARLPEGDDVAVAVWNGCS